MIILNTALIILLWLVCVLIVAVVLLQTGKGGGMAGVFGGGAGPESLLGTRATSFLVKVTTVLCLIFLAICLTLGRIGKQTLSRSKYETIASEAGEEAGGSQKPGESGEFDGASGDEAERSNAGE